MKDAAMQFIPVVVLKEFSHRFEEGDPSAGPASSRENLT
jgi:hypothetical protein